MTDTSAATLGRALARSGKYSGGSSSVVADFALPPKPADDETAGHSAEPDIPLPPEPPSDDANSDGGRRSVAARLVDLTLADFTLGVSDTDEPFAVPKARPHIAMPLRGGKTGYRPELARRFYDAHGTVPPAQALTDATSVLEGKAAAQTPQRLHLRAALADGCIDALVSDHTPVDENAKTLPFAEAEPGATGLELLLSLAIKWCETDAVSLARALGTLTSGPAAVLAGPAGSLAGAAGRLLEGAPADLCIFDPQAHWTVQPHNLRSKGKHTPFQGQELPARVRWTIVGGQLAFER